VLGRHGRIDSKVKVRPMIPETGTTIDVSVHVRPSRPYRIGSWGVRGNYKTKPEVFLRELYYAGLRQTRERDGEVVPGSVLDQRKLDLARKNIQFTGIVANKIDEATGELVRPGVNIRTFPREDGLADVMVDVNEGETGMLQLAASVNSDGDLVGTVEFSQRNFHLGGLPRSLTDWSNAFTGAGQTLSVSASFGSAGSTARHYFRADFEEPYLFGLPVSLNAGAFDSERSYDEYDDGRLGGKLSLSRSWSLHPYERRRIALFAAYRDEEVDIGIPDPTIVPPDFLAEEGASRLRRGKIGVSFDSRDRRMDPSSGWYASLSQSLVGGPFGGDKDYEVTELDVKRFFRLAETKGEVPFVLQMRLRFSNAGRRGPEPVPFYERFYAGGIFSLRGFDFRSVGPESGGVPVGGYVRLLENVEYTFPLTLDGALRGSVFYDAGNVWLNGDDFDFTDQKQSAGLGLLIQPEGFPFPIALYWGWILNEKPEDEARRFSFMFGTMFYY
jgi:outer membrane protein insertion porin family